MNILIGWKRYEISVSGCNISVELRPLVNEAMISIAPLMARDINKTDKVALYLETFKMQSLTALVLPAHARNLTGITVNGSTPTWEQLSTEAILAEAAVSILGKLFTISTLSESEEKNSERPSGSETAGVGLTP